ncbi:MAG TPA: tRNA preQ1(34) S-adenosylmethionine ribosyltransferase-isomerase QueA [Candidatus Paceibacterota bacterium]|nr:tRNA preQ1(34) S-adenosylmethionine ribosyltransferase-isomerase QueA [Candidatus Paceibacterota bacterium]HPP64620.1 tRNA preQ1(34) S-adenosylmethionine ribosyltransferase-isomerase QueA [Candidatus Paceibacterota bacterium]
MEIQEFDYHLPKELIASEPVFPRDHSKLMVLERKSGKIIHKKFYEIVDFLRDDDLLVFNDTKVINSRLYGRKKETKGKVEVFLLRQEGRDFFDFNFWPEKWIIIGKPNLKKGWVIQFDEELEGEITEVLNYERIIKFNLKGDQLKGKILTLGLPPLPPYIKQPTKLSYKNYQAIFAKKYGSVAAPTASFHFTKQLISKIKEKGVEMVYLTLHIGLGTFLPLKTESIQNHKLHPEFFEINEKTAQKINEAKRNKKRVIAVGTTVTRSLEHCAYNRLVVPQKGITELFIYPGYKFQIVDALITNFHLPKSTLLMLVCAFASKDLIFKAYQEAIEKKYRFFSFGDAMFIE